MRSIPYLFMTSPLRVTYRSLNRSLLLRSIVQQHFSAWTLCPKFSTLTFGQDAHTAKYIFPRQGNAFEVTRHLMNLKYLHSKLRLQEKNSTFKYGYAGCNFPFDAQPPTSFTFRDHDGQVSNVALSGHFLPEWTEKLRQEERAAKLRNEDKRQKQDIRSHFVQKNVNRLFSNS